MNDNVTSSEQDEEITSPTELDMLKDRARTLGVEFSGNIGVETLKKRIELKLSGGSSDDADDEAEEETAEAPAAKARPKTKAEQEMELRENLRKEKMALVRCRIYNLNPGKRDLHGEIVTVRNRYLGTVRKFIPFGEATENGYHIPKIIYDDLKARQFQQIGTKQKNGQIEVTKRMVPEYSIEVLPPLSKEELEELALKQAAAERLGAE